MPSDDRPAAPPADTVFPLGAHLTEGGARFAVASSSAEAVELCLIEPGRDGEPPTERRVELVERTFGIWHGQVPGIRAGQRYGYRVHGRYDPAVGLRSNPAKLLVDPYARRITGELTDLDAALGYLEDPVHGPVSTADSLGYVPLSVLTEPLTTTTAPRPDVPWADSVVYELHVRGFTRCHPEVPEHKRGTYLGLAHPSAIEYLLRLGVTAVELLPVHSFLDEPSLVRRGARNYWGYSTLGFFAPHAGYASVPGNEVAEFATMVSAMHRAGIEVILDVVYNHTCEGDVAGPTVSFRGLDAPAYYAHDHTGTQIDITGCGNTVDPASPTVARLVCDSLRYWAELGVDGFRFDLASVLGRPGAGPFDPRAGLLTMIAADPVLATRKLIAEPWDATGEGYRVGGFGVQWAEWNGQYRDVVRDFWRGAGGIDDLARRLSGSEDLYAPSGRRPWASVNFVTAHDGFTLRDLVSYQDKHNKANGEDNRDGTDDNRSRNFGVEGETTDPEIRAARHGAARAMLTTLLLSAGTPMLTAGDERWRTQQGNNNAYCQDNPVSWLDWEPGEDASALTAFTARLLKLRRDELAPKRDRFYRPEDVTWWRADGEQITDDDWHDPELRTVGMLSGKEWLVLLHSDTEPIDFRLPDTVLVPVLDTSRPDGEPTDPEPLAVGSSIRVPPSTVLVLTAP
ncbi:glycogen debranching protein GlgX [Pseudonocardia spinosispora]|uniref:glycogen debranching protein GlgX n=1 Tax=Pseudonocardia spinosispora TaxID=103441 RepID=UPI000684091F|nr:glycogen debranching protein GlgX [Pseudonocardia spinosispora]